MNVIEYWKEIDEYWEKSNIKKLQGAPKGASRDEIETLRQALEVPLPLELQRSLGCHNGDSYISLLSCSPNEFPLLMSVKQIVNKYKFSRESSNVVKNEYTGSVYHTVYGELPMPTEMWPSEWVPFLDNNGDITAVFVCNQGAGKEDCIIGVDVANGIIAYWYDSIFDFFDEVYKSLVNNTAFDFDILMTDR